MTGDLSGQAATPSGPDESLLTEVLEAVEEHLAERHLQLTPDKKARLVITLYEMIQEEEGAEIDQVKVGRLVKLIS